MGNPENSDYTLEQNNQKETYEKREQKSKKMPEYNTEYQKKIIRFFNNENIKSKEYQPNFDPDQDLEMSLLNNEMSSDLKKLFRKDGSPETPNPEEYSYALSYLINEMNCSGQQSEGQDPERKKSIETTNRQAKELFMESCKKIYPDIDEKTLENPRFILAQLKSLGATYYDVNFEINELAEFAKRGKVESDFKKLKEMAEKINLIFSDIETHNLDFGRTFKTELEGGDKKYVKDYKEKKAIINEDIYKLVLARDIVYEKLYGDKDISLEDAKKIDEAREKINNFNNPEKTQKKVEKPKETEFVNEKSPEREKTQEQIIKDVLKDGGVKFVMCFEEIVAKGQTYAGQQAYFEKMKNKQYRSSVTGEIVSHITSQEEYNRNVSDLRKIMWEKKINEVVDIRHVEEPIYKTVTTPGKKGFFGVGRTPDSKKEEFTGQTKKMMHSELVENGKNELAVRITYNVDKEGWKSAGMGRAGQNMTVEIVLPESLAKEVEKSIELDSSFIRTLSDEVVKEKILINPEEWEKPREYDYKIRPPYEKWDKEEGGGRIYVQKEGDARGWHEESVKKVKK